MANETQDRTPRAMKCYGGPMDGQWWDVHPDQAVTGHGVPVECVTWDDIWSGECPIVTRRCWYRIALDATGAFYLRWMDPDAPRNRAMRMEEE